MPRKDIEKEGRSVLVTLNGDLAFAFNVPKYAKYCQMCGNKTEWIFHDTSWDNSSYKERFEFDGIMYEWVSEWDIYKVRYCLEQLNPGSTRMVVRWRTFRNEVER